MSIEIPSKNPLEREVAAVADGKYAISTEESYHTAGERLLEIRALDEKIGTTFDPISKSISASLEVVRSTVRELREPLAEARKLITAARTGYEEEHERRRKEEMELEAQAARKMEQVDHEALEAMGLGDPSDSFSPAVMSMPVMPRLPKTPGIGQSHRWDVEITSMKELVKAVHEGIAPLDALAPEITILRAIVRRLKEKFNIPGVKAVRKKVTTTRI